MEPKLHILLIDDNPDDRALATRELQRALPGVVVDQITDAKALSLALDGARFNFVITDYQLRWTDGLSVLHAVKAHRPECPVIMFTGTGSEEIAVEAMKAGLDDYVLKASNYYARLPGAVKRALEQVAQRRSLKEAETRYRSLFNDIPIGVYKTTRDGKIIDANPAAVQMLRYAGREELLSINAAELYVDSAERQRWQVQIGSDGVVKNFVTQLRRRDGKVIWVEENARVSRDDKGEVLYYEGSMEDVTERLNLEAQLRQSQKMESVGQLAAGIAHDFNNILTIIKGHADLLLGRHALPLEFADPIKKISSAADRAANLTRQLLTFSRRQVMQQRVLDLNAVVQNVAKVLERTLGEYIALKLELASELPAIRADNSMIEQVIMNLALNARDAMPGGGELSIRTAAVEVDEPARKQNPDARPGHFVLLTVKDTGCGMDEQVMARIFEPFFTTKEVGKGTGLGLATVYGITKLHHGWIEVTSQLKHGTTFRVFLPAEAKSSEVVAESPVAAGEIRGGSETVLIVEDEPELRLLARQILECYGYRVLEAPTGAAALQLWPQHAQDVDLLLTDMVMPEGVTGWELAQRLQQQKPELKVICTTGYSMDLVNRRQELPGEVQFLQKPFKPQTLARTVRECLDA
jgi:PAS domain S-box-containing protein